jgi:hypothetical protein
MKTAITVLILLSLSGCGGGSSTQSIPSIQSCPSDGVGSVYASESTASFRASFQYGSAVSAAVVGDSTTVGDGANGSDNWNPASPYFLETEGYPTQAQQDDVAIPSAVRLLRTYIETINSESKVYNFGKAGAEASWHVANGTIAKVSALRVQVVFIAIGINTSKQGKSQHDALETLINQTLAAGMVPVLVKENTISYDYWACTRNDVDTLASKYGLDVIDLGSVEMFDKLHPNANGYSQIFNKYADWFDHR